MTFPNLWTTQGRLTRSQYALIGISCFAVKFVIDHLAANFVFHRPWSLQNYLLPIFSGFRFEAMSSSDVRFVTGMLAIALPFVWIGVACTLRRLRDAGLPLAFVVGFLSPLLNLILVPALCLVATKPEETRAAQSYESLPASPAWKLKYGQAAWAVVVSGLTGFVLTLLATKSVSNGYGLGLFVVLPFAIGFSSVVVYSRSGPMTFGIAVWLSVVSVATTGAALLSFAAEGAICIVMAAPIGILLAVAGGAAAFAFSRSWQTRRNANAMLSIVLLAVPSIMGGEAAVHRAPPVFCVKSSVVINAPPEDVWKRVIAFSEIPAPTDWVFRAGVAYPIRAEMVGRGVGAERHCIFSTGAFVEPIQVWDEPKLLKFSVTSNPPPMNELSPYGHIQPPHLHGYLESQGGQFRLEPLPGGKTLLEGTTWYKHGLWPAEYWRLWSDAVIHRIHMRVLDHIKAEVESNRAASQIGAGR